MRAQQDLVASSFTQVCLVFGAFYRFSQIRDWIGSVAYRDCQHYENIKENITVDGAITCFLQALWLYERESSQRASQPFVPRQFGKQATRTRGMITCAEQKKTYPQRRPCSRISVLGFLVLATIGMRWVARKLWVWCGSKSGPGSNTV